jgi:prolyl oligopeptidase
MDMLRYHTFTAGAGSYDYGTTARKCLVTSKAIPVHNVKAGSSISSNNGHNGDHDDRVVPAHSFKFAAELQKNKQEQPNPYSY